MAAGLEQSAVVVEADQGVVAVVLFDAAGQEVGRAQEVRHERRLGPLEEFPGGVELLDQAVAHHRDAVRHHQRLFLIVRHIDDGQAEFLLDGLDLHLQLVTQLLVQRAERFVHQDDRRAVDQRPAQGDPLLLTTGQLARLAAAEPGQARDLQRLPHPAADLVLRNAPQGEREGDVLTDRHVREEQVLLEDEPQAPLLRREAGDVPAADGDGAGVGFAEPGDHHQRRGLARAGGAEEGDELPRGDLHGRLVDGDDAAVGLAQSHHRQCLAGRGGRLDAGRLHRRCGDTEFSHEPTPASAW
ncbi:hypothetical protein SsS58_08735 [Streptomyces scabiei]|uniref:Uncharacterized protein n=1 Tax=Streptomyces scabiei TaxID=1930 RepID=A0A100JZ08_STRSC|nr:hypothetical protein SsS58_08735 [Streptomyces scabiei]